MPRWILALLLASLAGLGWAVLRSPGPATAPAHAGAAPPCPLVPLPADGAAPRQVPVDGAMPPFQHGRFRMTPLAGFSLQARVLSREDYRFDRGAELAPTDLALGWQRMLDPAVASRLNIWQSGRWYHYRWGSEGPPLPADEIVRSSANMHLVPANAGVAAALDRVRAGQQVELQGWLVEARSDDGWQWRSSVSREDSGDGACELVYVCAIRAR